MVYINTNKWGPWSHSHDLCMVSMQSGDSCTFRLLKYPHTSSGFSEVTTFMLSDGPLLETSPSALFPRRSNWVWTQGHCTVCFSRRTTARQRLHYFSINCARIVFFLILFCNLNSSFPFQLYLFSYFLIASVQKYFCPAVHLCYHCTVLGIANKPVSIISRYW